MGASLVRPIYNQMEPLSGRQALTVDSTAGGVALTIPTGAISARARLETAQIRYTLDTTAPTTTVGTLMNPDEILELDSYTELSNFRAIRTGGASGTLQVEYFGVDT